MRSVDRSTSVASAAQVDLEQIVVGNQRITDHAVRPNPPFVAARSSNPSGIDVVCQTLRRIRAADLDDQLCVGPELVAPAHPQHVVAEGNTAPRNTLLIEMRRQNLGYI